MNLFDTWLSHVQYKDVQFKVLDDGERRYLQASWPGTDAITGKPRECKGRKWLLSEHMTKSEVVQTAMAAVLAIEEHEARELFLYKGQPIFGPHYDVEKLVGLCDYGALDARH